MQSCPDVNNSTYTNAIANIALGFTAEATAEFGRTEDIYASFTQTASSRAAARTFSAPSAFGPSRRVVERRLVASLLRCSVRRFFAEEITSVESRNLLMKRFPPPDHLDHSEVRR